MKKSLIALATLGTFAGLASAQSSVTLFGVMDIGVRAVKNGDGSTVKSLTPSGLATSRFGLRGEEDLGGGLKAGFWLESDLNNDVGTVGSVDSPLFGSTARNTGKFFNRRSVVSLAGRFGEIRAGRDYTATFVNYATYDIYGAIGVGGILNLFGIGPSGVAGLGSGAGTNSRADNSIAYYLPRDLGGVNGFVMAGAGEGTNTVNGNNRYIGARLGWTGGPIDVGAAYSRTRIPGNNDFRVWNIGGAYNLSGVIKVTALYYRSDYEPTGLPNRSHKIWSLGVNVPIGASEIRATYQHADMGGGTIVGVRDQDDARQFAIGYIYNLSKRTALYADVGRLQNRGGSVLTIPGGTTNTGDFSLGGRNSTALALGVRHSF